MKSSKVSIKTRSTPASLSFKGQATKHTTVKWSIFKNSVEEHKLQEVREIKFNWIMVLNVTPIILQ